MGIQELKLYKFLFAVTLISSYITSQIYAECIHSCSHHGRCDKYNVCQCFDVFQGRDCSSRRCPMGKAWGVIVGIDQAHELEECSGRGICDPVSATCDCQSGFEGNACQKIACPGGCSGKGECLTLNALAMNKKEAIDHHNGGTYAYDTVWDHDKIQGCLCDSSHSGHNCKLRTCPKGDDPLSTSQTEEVQLIQCLTTYTEQQLVLNFDTTITAGTFILHSSSEHTRPLSHDADASSGGASVKEYLENLVSVDSVSVAKSTGANSRTWDLSFPSGNAAHNKIIPAWRRLEVQSFICVADGGAFSILFGEGPLLTDIAYDSDETALQNKLESLSSIGAVAVTFSDGTTACSNDGVNVVTVTFSEVRDRLYIGGDLPEMLLDALNGDPETGLSRTGTTAYLDSVAKELTAGFDSCRIVEVQTLFCAATGGLFSLTFDGNTVSNLENSITAQELESELESIDSIFDVDVAYSTGNTACSSGGNSIEVSFVVVGTLGALSDGDLPEITTDNTNGNVSPLQHTNTESLTMESSFTETNKGTVCTPLDQSFSSNPVAQMTSETLVGGGSFKVSYKNEMTEAIPADATTEVVENAISNLNSVDGVVVSFIYNEACTTPANLMQVTFTQNFGNLPTFSVDDSLLSVGSTVAVISGGDMANGIASFDGTKEDWECSGRGTCDYNSGTGCSCFQGFTSSNGQGQVGNHNFNRADCGAAATTTSDCPGEIPCSGHGFCSGATSYQCTCVDGWRNGECSERTCPYGNSWFSYPSADNIAHQNREECSGAGECDRTIGLCTCSAPFTGAACEHLSCGGEEEVCSGHGRCLSLSHLAPLIKNNGELAGYTYGSNPNNYNTWDAFKTRTCLCDDGYSGYDCSRRDCPLGDDPSTYDSVPEVQIVRCVATGGTFTLSFRNQETGAILYNDVSSEVESKLEALSTVGEVSVEFSSGVSACSTTGVVMIVTFETELGALPEMKSDNSLLLDSINYDGTAGTGVVNIAAHGNVLGVGTSVSGTRENQECSNHGSCDYRSGTCTCDEQYTSSNGKGLEGDKGDCGFIYLKEAQGEL